MRGHKGRLSTARRRMGEASLGERCRGLYGLVLSSSPPPRRDGDGGGAAWCDSTRGSAAGRIGKSSGAVRQDNRGERDFNVKFYIRLYFHINY